ncbi:MAG: amidohydrolase family protein [Thaumarchaeota archaeon]|nr:amidohydrolase family protein [Nitrososphaerota archaeon]
MIIDAHIHCSGRRKDDMLRPYAKLNGLRYDLEELLERMESNGVGRGLLLSPPMAGGEPLPNSEVVRLCERSGDALFPVFTVEPEKGAVKEALRLAGKHRGSVKAFKVWLGYRKVFARDEVFAPLYDYAEEHDLPVLFHTGDTATSTGSLTHAHPLTLDEVANERDGLKIVVCHMGNPWILDTAELLYKHPNVFADISGLMVGGGGYSEEYARTLARRISEAVYYAGGAEKIVFGTDYPVETHESGLSLVSLLAVSQLDKERILWRNASRLYSI